MAPLPQNNTHRLFVDYVTGEVATSKEHTLAVRYDPALRDVGDVQEDVLNVLNAMTEGLFREGWKVVRTRVQAAGSNFSLPVTTIAALAAFEGTASADYVPSLEAVEMTFQGRSPTSARRVDFSIYTAVVSVGNSFRYPAAGGGFGATVSAVLDELATAGAAGSFLCIDETVPVWYDYANVQYNSYWESRIRQG